MPKSSEIYKEVLEVSQIISKYSRKRLYQIFREKIDTAEFKEIEAKRVEKDKYSLVIEEGKVFFQPGQSKDLYPIFFTIEDLKNNKKDYLKIIPKGVLKHADDDLFLLKTQCGCFNADIVLDGRQDYLVVNGRVKSNSEQIVRLGVELGVDAVGWNWYEGLRDARKIEERGQYYLYSRDFRLGKRGKLPFYSFGNISNAKLGLTLGVNPQEPRLFEIAYDSKEKRYQIFFDMAISPKTKKFPNEVTFSAFLFALDGKNIGFRGSVKKYYELFPVIAEKRVKKDGNWMPFDDIASIVHAEDFCFACHELNIHHDGSLRGKADIDYNKRHNIYNFAYTEPWLCWLHMPKDMERNYDTTLELMEKNLNSGDEKERDFASGGLTSSIRLDDGKYFVRIEDAPWCYGAVYNTNTNPGIATDEKCPLNRAEVELKQVVRCLKKGYFDGIYLDSMQSTEVIDDYDERHFEVADFPLTFDKDKKKPVICQFITAYHFTELLADYLHDKGKLLMANFPAAFTFFSQHIDAPGEETGWIEKGCYKALNDKELSMRRVLSFKKPYLFLQSVDFDEFNKEMVESYMKRCLFYGMLPSMFSFNAQDKPYWQNPDWYNRDRDLFKKYLPHIVSLSKAGWEPAAGVSVDNNKIFIEQFGKLDDDYIYITCCNQTKEARSGKIDLSKILNSNSPINIKEALTGKNYSAGKENPYLDIALGVNEVMLLKINF